MAYPLVHITNSTNYPASGKVGYLSAFCSDDNYSVDANKDWRASSRGVCLLGSITATLTINGQSVTATPYQSTGTAYSEFAIIQTGNNYAVVRVAGMAAEADTDLGAVEAEPTEQQK